MNTLFFALSAAITNPTFNLDQLNRFSDRLFDERQKFQTDALVIVKENERILERYRDGFDENKKHMLWSFSKTITGAIIYAAIDRGLLDLDTLVSDAYPQLKNDPRGKFLKVRHLLKMESGFDYIEKGSPSILSQTLYVLFEKNNFKDAPRGVLNLGFAHRPGRNFNYATIDPTLLMGVLRHAIKNDTLYWNFPWEALFDPAGMNDMSFERDLSGNFVGGMSAFGSANDMIRFASLYLNEGKNSEGKEVLDPKWIKESFETSPAQASLASFKGRNDHNRYDYGSFFWKNKKLKGSNENLYPEMPSDFVTMIGYQGQILGILPTQKVIVLRLGNDGHDEVKLEDTTMFNWFSKTFTKKLPVH